MKQTYTNQSFNLILIAIAFYSTVQNMLKLFGPGYFLSSLLVPIAFIAISFGALISMTMNKLNGERFSRFFIIITLILPPTLVFIQYLTDVVFYGMNRWDLVLRPILYLQLIVGIILFLLSIRFSRTGKSERIADYGILIALLGIFLVVYTLTRVIEASLSILSFKYFINTTLGLFITYLGYRLKNRKMTLQTCMALCFIAIIISRFVGG